MDTFVIAYYNPGDTIRQVIMRGTDKFHALANFLEEEELLDHEYIHRCDDVDELCDLVYDLTETDITILAI